MRAIEIKAGMLLAHPAPKFWYIAVEKTGNLSTIRYGEHLINEKDIRGPKCAPQKIVGSKH
jgi:hypothetical protein